MRIEINAERRGEIPVNAGKGGRNPAKNLKADKAGGKDIMQIGYIQRYDLKLNPHITEHFKFIEAPFTRTINSKGDKIRSKMLMFPVNYEEIVNNAEIMKTSDLILVCEPFLLDDELREKVEKWVKWANKAAPKEYDPFYKEEIEVGENIERN